ncbi:hypothetical protein BZA05DRAFT_422422 [Tricharina praecox]|uniref:uncharacterized protein n=1 Tax=Tricharina praecox TaxID=43433 RepID=UPI0022209C90|nr:uncharacterized protein BZA05DRAFT_422422 [Tricharina praecox]KAI5842783.1 hypothetical protein BZA05DRAFT_422422 [Tricharina praecox]
MDNKAIKQTTHKILAESHTIHFPHFEIPGIDDTQTNPESKFDPTPIVRPNPASDVSFNYYNSTTDVSAAAWLCELVCETSWASLTYTEIDGLVDKLVKSKKTSWM